MSTHRCRYCGGRIYKVLIGWMHDATPFSIHVPRPRRSIDG